MTSGKYRIQAVADMTGIPAATLRAWERRYGVPAPERTESSYRLYSDTDVDLIRRLRELCDGGMAPAEAARVVRRSEGPEEETPVDPSDDPFRRAQSMILEAVDAFDPAELELGVRRMMFLGSAPTVFDKVLAPVMRQVGDRWHAGQLSIGQEHMATEILSSAARDMLRLFTPDRDAPMAVLACFADEEHALPLYGVAFRLAQWGHRPVILGARTPPAAIRDAVERLQPALVGLSITIAPPAYRVRELVDAYAGAVEGRPWLVGGYAAQEIRAAVESAGGQVVTEAGAELKNTIERAVLDQRRGRHTDA